MSKGSKDRVRNRKAFEEGWTRVYGHMVDDSAESKYNQKNGDQEENHEEEEDGQEEGQSQEG